MTAVAIELRRLSLANLGDIEKIEQSAYPTPWDVWIVTVASSDVAGATTPLTPT